MDISQISLSGMGHQRLFIPFISVTIINLKYEGELISSKNYIINVVQHDSYVYCCQYFKSRVSEVQKKTKMFNPWTNRRGQWQNQRPGLNWTCRNS